MKVKSIEEINFPLFYFISRTTNQCPSLNPFKVKANAKWFISILYWKCAMIVAKVLPTSHSLSFFAFYK